MLAKNPKERATIKEVVDHPLLTNNLGLKSLSHVAMVQKAVKKFRKVRDDFLMTKVVTNDKVIVTITKTTGSPPKQIKVLE